MEQKKYQVFISSTYTDLVEERKKVQEVLLMVECIPAGMEAFVATNDEQFNVIKKVIDLCDYYVLIIGKRYGSINERTGLSYTEMEYDYAVEKGIPVLVFALDYDVEVSPEKEETEESAKYKLWAFRQKTTKNRLVSFWKSTSDLGEKVIVSIVKARDEYVRPGWIRGDKIASDDSKDLTISLQKENKELSEKNKQLEEKLRSLEFDDTKLAFYNYPVEIKLNNGETRKTNLKDIYAYISLEMGGYECRISYVEDMVAKFIGVSRSRCDETMIKRIVNHYVALGLLEECVYDDEENCLKLTEKGKRVKNELNTFKKPTTTISILNNKNN